MDTYITTPLEVEAEAIRLVVFIRGREVSWTRKTGFVTEYPEIKKYLDQIPRVQCLVEVEYDITWPPRLRTPASATALDPRPSRQAAVEVRFASRRFSRRHPRGNFDPGGVTSRRRSSRCGHTRVVFDRSPAGWSAPGAPVDQDGTHRIWVC